MSWRGRNVETKADDPVTILNSWGATRGTWWIAVCAAVAIVAVSVTLVHWRRSVRTQAQERSSLAPTGTPQPPISIIPNPFGSDAEVLAAVPADYLPGLKNVKDDTSRMAKARSYAAENHFTGSVAELAPFFAFVEEYHVGSVAPTDQVVRERTQTAALMLYILTVAWHDVGPFDNETTKRIETSAVRLSGDNDPAIRIGALLVFRVFSAPGSPYTLSAAGKHAMATLAADAQTSFQADRTVAAVLARPKRDGKNKGG